MAIASELDSSFNLGSLIAAVPSNIWAVTETGTYDIVIEEPMGSGKKIEYRLNGGGWLDTGIEDSVVVSTIAGITSGDDLEIRHNRIAGSGETFCKLSGPTAIEAYAIIAY